MLKRYFCSHIFYAKHTNKIYLVSQQIPIFNFVVFWACFLFRFLVEFNIINVLRIIFLTSMIKNNIFPTVVIYLAYSIREWKPSKSHVFSTMLHPYRNRVCHYYTTFLNHPNTWPDRTFANKSFLRTSLFASCIKAICGNRKLYRMKIGIIEITGNSPYCFCYGYSTFGCTQITEISCVKWSAWPFSLLLHPPYYLPSILLQPLHLLLIIRKHLLYLCPKCLRMIHFFSMT